MNYTNTELFNLAKQYIPGGVNSPVRSFSAVGGVPFFTKSATGAFLIDSQNKRYIDYVCSWGANIVGHANPYVVEKVKESLNSGFSFGTPTELEIDLARLIIKLMPNIEKLRLVSSGTEATMSAIRLARGYTQKKYIIKFNGCYHGHSDNLLVSGGSGLTTFGVPSSNGVTKASIEHTLVLEYNSISDLEMAFNKYPDDIACVILEAFAGNMNFVRPTNEFLVKLRHMCDKHKSLLIFDEVMTGFRVSLRGAQDLFGIRPDLTTLGKIVGGGMPLAAFGGKASIMDCLSPLGSVYQAGTLSGNPVAVTAGLATLEIIQASGFYDHLNQINYKLTNGLEILAKQHGIPFITDYVGGMFGFYFTDKLPHNLQNTNQASIDIFNKFFHYMLNNGVYFAPSVFEAGFICSSHDEQVIDQTLAIAKLAFSSIR